MIWKSNDKAKFPNKLLLTEAQATEISKAFINGSLANIKFSKTQLCKIIQSRRSFGMFNPIIPISLVK